MKKFSFSLQAVLNVRIIAEDCIKQELAKEQKQLDEEEKKLAWLQDRWDKACCLPAEDVLQMMHQQYYREMLKKHIEVQKKVVIQRKDALNQVRERALKAERERKVLENLKDRQEKQHHQKALTEEQRFLDEIAVLRFARIEK